MENANTFWVTDIFEDIQRQLTTSSNNMVGARKLNQKITNFCQLWVIDNNSPRQGANQIAAWQQAICPTCNQMWCHLLSLPRAFMYCCFPFARVVVNLRFPPATSSKIIFFKTTTSKPRLDSAVAVTCRSRVFSAVPLVVKVWTDLGTNTT